MSDLVASFDVYIEIDIYKTDEKYEWWASNGEDSREWFETEEDARKDAQRHFE